MHTCIHIAHVHVQGTYYDHIYIYIHFDITYVSSISIIPCNTVYDDDASNIYM